ADPLDRKFQELIGRGALPARIVRREMLADVTVGDGTEDGVDDGMESDVGVGVSGQASVVRNPDAAKPEMIAVGKGVHVEAVAEAEIGETRDPPRLGLGEVFVGGEFHVAGFAGKYANLQACPFAQRCVVGEIVKAALGGAPMRLKQRSTR